jgi:hypothetical protein
MKRSRHSGSRGATGGACRVVAVTEGGGGASPRKAMKKVGQVGPAKAEQARRWKLDLGGRN